MAKKYVDAIEVSNAIDAMANCSKGITAAALYDLGRFLREDVPAANVEEIVRCENCIKYNNGEGYCIEHKCSMNPDDFCSLVLPDLHIDG